MSEPICAESMMHRGEKRIKLILPYRHDNIERVKQISGRRWSKTKKCWHLPYTQACFEELKNAFADVDILIPERAEQVSQNDHQGIEPPKAQRQVQQDKHTPVVQQGKVEAHQVKLVISPQKFFLQLKKQEADLKFHRSLRYTRWNERTYLWEVTHSEHNLQLLRHYFADRLSEQELAHPEKLVNNQIKRYPVRELSVAVQEGRLRLMFAFDQALITFIKQLPFPRYDGQNRWWSVADSPVVRADLEKYCQEHGWKPNYTKISSNAGDTNKVSKRETANYRKCPQAMLDLLTAKRYCSSTIRTYTSMFEDFINPA